MKVKIHIDANGVVTKVDVLEKVGDGFDEAAVAAAMQYVFDPAEIDGKPAAIAVETAINFVIEQTGYPPEIVRLDADLEADLGIDSIKKAQLFGELATGSLFFF